MSVTRAQVEELVGEAYEIGRAHGGNAFRSPDEQGARVDEGWAQQADKLCELLGIDQQEERRDKLKSYFDAAGDNFMGSGLSLVEFMALGKLESYERALSQQPLEERRRRWDLIHRMCEEQARLRMQYGQVGHGGKLYLYGEAINCHTAIEAVYEGDWKKLEDVSRWLTFPDDISNPGDEIWVERYEPFRQLVLAAIEGAPSNDVPVFKKCKRCGYQQEIGDVSYCHGCSEPDAFDKEEMKH